VQCIIASVPALAHNAASIRRVAAVAGAAERWNKGAAPPFQSPEWEAVESWDGAKIA